MQFVSRQWTAQGWCVGHTWPSPRAAGGRMWGFEDTLHPLSSEVVRH